VTDHDANFTDRTHDWLYLFFPFEWELKCELILIIYIFGYLRGGKRAKRQRGENQDEDYSSQALSQIFRHANAPPATE